MKRDSISWTHIAILFIVNVLILVGCESPTDKSLYSELKLSGKVTESYYNWAATDEGKALMSMTFAAKKELARKIRVERIGADAVEKEEEKERLEEEERKRQIEASKKAENQPETEIEVEEKPVIHKKYKSEEVDIDRIKWTTHHNQESW